MNNKWELTVQPAIENPVRPGPETYYIWKDKPDSQFAEWLTRVNIELPAPYFTREEAEVITNALNAMTE